MMLLLKFFLEVNLSKNVKLEKECCFLVCYSSPLRVAFVQHHLLKAKLSPGAAMLTTCKHNTAIYFILNICVVCGTCRLFNFSGVDVLLEHSSPWLSFIPCIPSILIYPSLVI